MTLSFVPMRYKAFPHVPPKTDKIRNCKTADTFSEKLSTSQRILRLPKSEQNSLTILMLIFDPTEKASVLRLPIIYDAIPIQ